MRLSAILVSAAVLAISCSQNVSPKYGDPVFGTVTDETPTVTISTGMISGENRDGIAIFRGIPYGGNCDGANRFKAPTPVEPWEGVRDCSVNGNIAMQNSGSISANPSPLGTYFNGGHPELFGCENEKENENCLVLNVLTPGIDNASRPVIVYFHGGGFATGSGTLVLGADKLSREEDVVIVGVNHRLNVFGYLYLGAYDNGYAASASVGMQDLVQSLQWVKDNIAVFGGDPANVTIMGESGGAMKVCTLLAMPSAQGLFSKAIIESGASPAGSLSPEAAAVQTAGLIEKLGLTDWKQLLEIPAKQLLDASAGFNFSPVADGSVIPYTEGGQWAPEISSGIPVLVGASADEMGVFTPIDQFAQTINDENLPQMLQSSPMGKPMDSQKAEAIVKVYKEQNFKNDEPWHTYIKIISTSGMLGAGAYELAFARSSKGFAPVYHYFVEYDSISVQSDSLRCAWHTADLPLQFRVVLHPETEGLSKQMAHAWATFARTGNPSTEELPWPAFTPEERNVMVFDDVSEVKVDPLKEMREVTE